MGTIKLLKDKFAQVSVLHGGSILQEGSFLHESKINRKKKQKMNKLKGIGVGG